MYNYNVVHRIAALCIIILYNNTIYYCLSLVSQLSVNSLQLFVWINPRADRTEQIKINNVQLSVVSVQGKGTLTTFWLMGRSDKSDKFSDLYITDIQTTEDVSAEELPDICDS